MAGCSSVATMKEFIDSDRVNFLVWRYLLEANFRETAAKFQKEWHIQSPHRHFDFAPHVKNHALVTVLNRGLLYYALEREFAQSQVPQNNLPATAEEMPRGVFGPLIVQQPPPKQTTPAAGASAPSAQGASSTASRPAPTTSSATEPNAPASATTAAAAAATGAGAGTTAAAHDEDEDAIGEDVVPTIEEADNSRKRQLQLSNESSPPVSVKRPRLSNGYENGTGPDSATTPMEIDTHNHADAENNNHAYPSPLEADQVPTPLARTYGPEQGTQIDKVEELAAETIFLSMSDDDAGPGTGAVSGSDDSAAAAAAAAAAGATNAPAEGGAVPPATPPTEAAPSRTQHNPIVLHCEWNPSDPSILAAAGTDALARVWTISRPTAPDPLSNHVDGHVDSSVTHNQPFENLVDDDATPSSTVSAMAWNWDGSAIAMATEPGNKARINIWAKDGSHQQQFDLGEPPVIKLKWNPNNLSILAIAPDNDGTLVTVLGAQIPNTVSHNLPNHDLESSPLDAAWISETEFILCGGRVLESFRCTEKDIVPSRTFPTREDDSFSQVQFDWRSKLVATASDSGVIDLWDEAGQRRSISAHSGQITDLAWQPLLTNPADDERLLASGGDDGIVSIWNARVPENKPKWSVTMDPPVVALAFTPDGAFLAGATPDKILIWKVGEYSMPRASWSRTAHPGWLNPRAMVNGTANGTPNGTFNGNRNGTSNGTSNGTTNVEEATHCLCWDSTGQKLAYGTNSRVAIINFR